MLIFKQISEFLLIQTWHTIAEKQCQVDYACQPAVETTLIGIKPGFIYSS